jgi:two-component system KDP operon response regulator KdpE
MGNGVFVALIEVGLLSESRRAMLIDALQVERYETTEALTSEQVLREAFDQRPDAIILEVDIDAEGDIDVLKLIAVLSTASEIPILALLRRSSLELAVSALELGAEAVTDNLAPVDEIIARLRAVLRRRARIINMQAGLSTIHTGDLIIDRRAQTLMKRGALINLTRTEFRLLDALASRAGETAPHRFLLSSVWGEEFAEDPRHLRVYVGYLRAKLEDDLARPRYLVNEWGQGYRLALIPPRLGPASAPLQARLGRGNAHDASAR